jgi:hypothetical protein
MIESSKQADRSTWATGGGAILGLGVGLFFLQKSALAFVGRLLGGLGLGLIITAVLSSRGANNNSLALLGSLPMRHHPDTWCCVTSSQPNALHSASHPSARRLAAPNPYRNGTPHETFNRIASVFLSLTAALFSGAAAEPL